MEDVAEHLDIETTGTIAFRHEGIDIAAAVVDAVGQSYFRQELVEGGILLMFEDGAHGSLHVDTHHVLVEVGNSTGGIVDLVPCDIIAESQGGLQTVSEQDVGLVEETIVGLGSAEQAGNRLGIHRDMTASGTFNHCLGSLHTHTLCHRVEHTIVGIVLNSLREELVHIGIEEHRGVGLQPLV